ncbi:MAG: NAD(P)H-binding protein [Spirochaetales bacterium]|jgi:nucleoside-diphosphate-sugar epimerase|nr:NAD(P)H-binding protein [Spirochaetales bacterium]
MKITLLGATGFVGKVLLKKLIFAGHRVTVLARNPDKLDDMIHKVTVVKGDYFVETGVDAAVEGAEAVLSTVGPGMHEKSAVYTEQSQKTIDHLLSVLEKQGTRKFIMIGGAGIPLRDEKLPFNRKLLYFMMKTFFGVVVATKSMEINTALDSKLPVTVVRPAAIKPQLSGSVHADERIIGKMAIDVGQLADFMIDQLTDDTWVGKAPVVWTK